MIGRSRIPAVFLFVASLATSYLGSTLLAPTLLAQNASTSLRGSVTDSTGAAIPGAAVSIKNNANGSDSSTKANGQGEYSFQQIAPGKYTITVEMAGFAKQTLSAELLVAQPATINVKLGVTAESVTVDVSAAAQTLNTTDATIGNAINNQTIMELPSEARNPATLLALQPGVLYIGDTNSTESRNGVVSGARADQTNITLDGVDNNDQIAPSAFTGVLRTTLDSTEEFRVTTSNANADSGRSSGGQVNLVTRSGTNSLHGAIYDYNRTNVGEANDWFAKQGQLNSDLPNSPPKLIYNVYGIRLGGPIKKDKLFLFGNYEGFRRDEGVAVSQTVPTASLAAGNLKYNTTDGSTVTLTPTQFASMDTKCSANGTCPNGAGVNPFSLALFKAYPLPNGFASGDGLNTGSYSFSSPAITVENVYITRLDYNPADKYRFYVRSSMQNDSVGGASAFPGQPAATKHTDDSKGISGNFTWTIKSNLINNARYGFTRQSFADTGAAQGNYTTYRTLSTPDGETSSAGPLERTSSTVVPSHNFIDDLTWTKGKHTIQFGANFRVFNYQNSTDANSYNSGSENVSWLLNSGFTKKPGTFNPTSFGLPAVNSDFTTNYNYAVGMLAGLTGEETDHFNYQLSADGKTGTVLGVGVPVKRSFKTHELEYYVQDAWKPLPNLTITAGLRHTILQTPYEANGQQVQPTINIHDWFTTRAAQAAQGNSVQPPISFAPAGQARGGKPFYPMNWGNIAPRFAFAFAPAPEDGTWMNKLLGGAGKSSIRAGFGIYYDHFGEGLVTNYSRHGSFSLSSSLTNPASSLTADTTPRFTGLHNLPGLIDPSAGATTINYPQTPSTDINGTGFAITNGLDDRIKTPYSEVFNLSVQRELKGGFTFEADYVGRLGRHLLQQLDLAQPLNLVDPKSGTDYYTAATQLAKLVDQGATTVAPIPYFEDLFPDAAGVGAADDGTPGASATQNIYDLDYSTQRGNETQALNNLDEYCDPGCGGQIGRYWPLQYSSLYVTSSDGSANYNALQAILRHPMKNNIQFDLSYTFSKSLDLGSDSEANPTSSGNSYGFLIDGFNPRKNYAVSDFNTKHLFTGDWVLKLPVGTGQKLAGNSSRLVNAVIGGWDTSGIARVSSGLPFGLSDGNGWATNWEYESYVVQTGPIKFRKHLDSNGSPQYFDDPLAALANTRNPYPGEAGQRSKYFGDGYFDIDAGVHKNIAIGERYSFSLAAEVFNVTNSVRFDVHSLDTGSTDGSQAGVYSSTLTQYRRMQFSGRFDF
ncbi:hypothetical protein HDF16_001504 [Granulicella aggregans]|uniref:TonB-dependent transporter Oar-like beta-barrel domain-containing protein n=1 Tax=Granulicella aggregans TaxID=474949 RepID=A0A7W7ZBZ7_9BACT|nr:carboxypeptidase-like regulatory domain-containing protein [Granulicella aggregans]MBB5056819.1 hypothetical protein [Granulicella aggregans]